MEAFNNLSIKIRLGLIMGFMAVMMLVGGGNLGRVSKTKFNPGRKRPC